MTNDPEGGVVTPRRARRRPGADEYAGTYGGYVRLVPDGDIVRLLAEQRDTSLALLAAVPPEKLEYRYAPGKWTTREVVGHVIDTEWVFTYRALRIARGDRTPLAGMDQDELMAGAGFGTRDMASLLDEFRHLRSANMVLFQSFDETVLDRRGTASGCEFTVRAILYIVAGHMRHHVQVLQAHYL